MVALPFIMLYLMALHIKYTPVFLLRINVQFAKEGAMNYSFLISVMRINHLSEKFALLNPK